MLCVVLGAGMRTCALQTVAYNAANNSIFFMLVVLHKPTVLLIIGRRIYINGLEAYYKVKDTAFFSFLSFEGELSNQLPPSLTALIIVLFIF